jgi:hypothetical protein
MGELEEVVSDIACIYQRSSGQAEEYLRKARKLKEQFGLGAAVVYCWFYSVPQKWAQVEPKIFELLRYTNSFDIDVILSIPKGRIAHMLKPMIFNNEISTQLKKFCETIKSEYGSWSNLVKALEKEEIFTIFKNLRSYKNNRITFKNLAAMKIFIGMNDDFLILDTHVAKIFGINRNEANKYRTQESQFKNLLEVSRKITEMLRRKGFNGTSTALWSLALWFNGAKVPANRLLTVIK